MVNLIQVSKTMTFSSYLSWFGLKETQGGKGPRSCALATPQPGSWNRRSFRTYNILAGLTAALTTNRKTFRSPFSSKFLLLSVLRTLSQLGLG